MAERGIIFSGPMVRALLDGTKTQTRRIAKLTDAGHVKEPRGHRRWHPEDPDARLACPYGQPGDTLWVRETWVELLAVSPATDSPMKIGPGERLLEEPTFWTDDQGRKRWRYDGRVLAYRANSDVEFCDGDGFSGELANHEDMPRWRPSIFMPRWASRITLRLTEVRLQRLMDISEEDARAEGFKGWHSTEEGPVVNLPGGHTIQQCGELVSDSGAFLLFWDKLHGDGATMADPYVWALTFERLPPQHSPVPSEKS